MTSIVESTGVTIIISVLPTPLLVCELKPSSGGVVSVADGGGDVGVLSVVLEDEDGDALSAVGGEVLVAIAGEEETHVVVSVLVSVVAKVPVPRHLLIYLLSISSLPPDSTQSLLTSVSIVAFLNPNPHPPNVRLKTNNRNICIRLEDATV